MHAIKMDRGGLGWEYSGVEKLSEGFYIYVKGVGEGGGAVGLCPPTFGQSKCFNFTICSYFVVKNIFFQNFLGSLSLANINKSIFSNFANIKL